MRIKIKFFASGENALNYQFNKYDIQGMIYSSLLDAGIYDIHNGNKIRFFSFSDIFPLNKVKKDLLYNFIISSPIDRIINDIYDILSKNEYFYLSGYRFNIAEIKRFDLGITGSFITGSPVVLYLDNRKNRYFSIKNGDSISFFLKRLKENAIKKFNIFYNDDINLNHLLFDKMEFHKEVSLLLKKGNNDFNIIGTMWYKLNLSRLNRGEIKFYKFIMDTGIGEKNSLGFGFINPVVQNGQ
ncbi:CRISPR-associated endoribonuclease Cas6 [Acidiplasma aeolicum]|jgi:CRISPR-associated endoribonuclease Cas6|uniref:CRISPR-associated endoribonuclease Cas6 n=1 Tax=Acidiplasma aeolicum TaxID=507754 RepID=UPI0037117BFD